MTLRLFDPECTTPAVRVEIEDGLSPDEERLIERARLAGLAPFQRWSVVGSNQAMNYATHGLFRFFGKFPPPIAAHLIETYTCRDDVVCDLTCGSGTTGVEALLHGRPCLLADVNPLALLLSSVKTTPISLERTVPAIERVEGSYQALLRGGDLAGPVGLRNPQHWFLPATSKSLAALRAACDKEEQPELRRFLLGVFASVVRRVSRATTQQGRLFLDASSALEDALPTFVKRARFAAEAVDALPSDERVSVQVVERDIREPIDEGSVAQSRLIIIHPPYFNAYRYSSVNSLELAWLGVPHAAVRRLEVREYFKVGKRDKVTEYVADMSRALGHVATAIAPGTTMVLMIGDTMIHGEHVAVVRMLLDACQKHPLHLERIALRLPRFSEASWVASQRRNGHALGSPLHDYVLIFTRTP